MLTREENEMLCRVGPGTPMGSVLRRFWTPACLSVELPDADCDPLAVRLLGEDFVAFRDSTGGVGIVNEHCMHRGSSLLLGRVEDGGIRCIYHGWKFGADGTVQETPSEPAVSTLRERLHAPVYPVREAGGLVWVYLGPADREPLFPEYPWLSLAHPRVASIKLAIDCNWAQVLEGAFDSAHIGVLHFELLMGHRKDESMRVEFPTDDNGPAVEVETTDFGFHYAAIRQSAIDPGTRYVRVSPFILPYVQYVPPSLRDDFDTVSLFVPYDDEHTAHYDVRWTSTGTVDTESMFALHGMRFGDTIDSAYHWKAVPANRWGQDRAAMRRGESFNGFEGVAVQDAAVQVSMGRTLDRTREHLGVADTAIVRLRRLLLESARDVANGGDPLGLAHPVDTASIVSATATLPAGTPWQSLVPAHRPLHSNLAAEGTDG